MANHDVKRPGRTVTNPTTKPEQPKQQEVSGDQSPVNTTIDEQPPVTDTEQQPPVEDQQESDLSLEEQKAPQEDVKEDEPVAPVTPTDEPKVSAVETTTYFSNKKIDNYALMYLSRFTGYTAAIDPAIKDFANIAILACEENTTTVFDELLKFFETHKKSIFAETVALRGIHALTPENIGKVETVYAIMRALSTNNIPAGGWDLEKVERFTKSESLRKWLNKKLSKKG